MGGLCVAVLTLCLSMPSCVHPSRPHIHLSIPTPCPFILTCVHPSNSVSIYPTLCPSILTPCPSIPPLTMSPPTLYTSPLARHHLSPQRGRFAPSPAGLAEELTLLQDRLSAWQPAGPCTEAAGSPLAPSR